MGSWWSEHPDLEGVARRGRSEIEEESVAAERDAEHLRRRQRTLIDVCYEWMSRGDQVTFAVADHQFEGRLVAAVNDLVVMTTRTREVAVNTKLIGFARCDKTAVFAGTTGARTVSSFRAELGRHEVESTPIRLLGKTNEFDVVGAIEASTEDHVLLRDRLGVEWVLPRTEIACAISETIRNWA